ncbi:MAG TPA: hypothetical protein VGN82_14225 [Bosea sp. (in: a-proteobacteria)]|uniref:hypothetical protein n=1 Tax=Bosea sp. (in: a-proteobacteria) TaxID=1871050 RepID=UPI002E12527F|nr:hypothetical protein [Bosea sp. (in: a-proteobacteria)]
MKLTLDLPDDLVAKLDEWIEQHVEFRPTREEALQAIIQQRLAPMALETANGLYQMAQHWQVAEAQLPAGTRPCLILSPAEGAGMMMLLDDKQALEMASQLVDVVKERGPGSQELPH